MIHISIQSVNFIIFVFFCTSIANLLERDQSKQFKCSPQFVNVTKMTTRLRTNKTFLPKNKTVSFPFQPLLTMYEFKIME